MLFLDLDGTLLSIRKRTYAAYLGVLEQPDVRGVPIPERLFWEDRRRGKGWPEVLRASRVLPMKHRLFLERFQERQEAPELLGLDELVEGAFTFLGKVHTKTPIVLVAQRRDREALESQLADLKVRPYFVEVLAGTPPPTRRPDPTLEWRHKAALVRARYRMPPREALWIGDTEVDVQAARSLGLEVWLIEGGDSTKERLVAANPDRIEAHLPGSLEHLLTGGRWQR